MGDDVLGDRAQAPLLGVGAGAEHGEGSTDIDPELDGGHAGRLMDPGRVRRPVDERRIELTGWVLGLQREDEVEGEPRDHERVRVVLAAEAAGRATVEGECTDPDGPATEREREGRAETDRDGRWAERGPGVVLSEVLDEHGPSEPVGVVGRTLTEVGLEGLPGPSSLGRAHGLERSVVGDEGDAGTLRVEVRGCGRAQPVREGAVRLRGERVEDALDAAFRHVTLLGTSVVRERPGRGAELCGARSPGAIDLGPSATRVPVSDPPRPTGGQERDGPRRGRLADGPVAVTVPVVDVGPGEARQEVASGAERATPRAVGGHAGLQELRSGSRQGGAATESESPAVGRCEGRGGASQVVERMLERHGHGVVTTDREGVRTGRVPDPRAERALEEVQVLGGEPAGMRLG